MRKMVLAIVVLTLSANSLGREPATSKRDISQTAVALNNQSKSQLGVGIFSLALLAEAGPGHFFPKSMLEKNGSWSKYQELEKAGFVRLIVSDGLPDGTAAGTEFVAVELTSSGQQVRSALLKP